MRYYCESYSESVNHVTPTILMLDNELQREGHKITSPETIIDLGCGNGRNSLYLAKKYNPANVLKMVYNILEQLVRLQNYLTEQSKSLDSTIKQLQLTINKQLLPIGR
jgi:tRNA1(Val) A37 N6-methylase TrmN6